MMLVNMPKVVFLDLMTRFTHSQQISRAGIFLVRGQQGQ